LTLRISRTDSEAGTVLRVDGRLKEEVLEELEKACEGVPSPLTLDLEGLTWIDEKAGEALEQLMAHGAAVTNASPYVALLLKGRAKKT
jgi:hypothetical protein